MAQHSTANVEESVQNGEGAANMTSLFRATRFEPKRMLQYCSKFLGFISKIREPKELRPDSNQKPKYTFVDGAQKVQFCPKLSNLNIDDALKFPLSFEKSAIPINLMDDFRFVKERTEWGFNVNKISARPCIPCDISNVNEQINKMTPIIQFINWHPDIFKSIKPHFVCNRFILKKLMILASPEFSFTFSAERKNNTIYLREFREAEENVGDRSIINKFSSILLTGEHTHEVDPEEPLDFNESLYGIYAGTIGDDIRVLFSAEIDGFWLPEFKNDLEPSATRNSSEKLERRMLEVKTMNEYLWRDRNLGHWQTAMAANWAQCFLVNCKDIVCGLLSESVRSLISQLMVFDVKRILPELQDLDNHGAADKSTFYISRLRTTLSTVLKQVTQETPAIYVVSVRQVPKAESKLVIHVREVKVFDNFPTEI